MKHRPLLAVVEAVVVLAVVSFVYVRHLNTVAFHIDESHWIGTSYMYESFMRGRFWSDTWKESHETITNPPVPRYVIGFGRSLGGYRRSEINRIWQYDQDYAYNVSRGAMPSDGLLWWSRFPMAILAVVSTLLAFWFVRKIAGRAAAYIWILWATANGYLLLHTRRAMAESPILFFVMLASAFTYLATERLTRDGKRRPDWQTWLDVGAAGTSIGLAGASKLNGLALLVVPFFCMAVALYRRHESGRSRLTQFVALSVVVTALTFVAFLGSYPYLWPDLLGRTTRLFTNRVGEMRLQAAAFPDQRVGAWNQRFAIVSNRVLNDYAAFPIRGAIYVNGGLVVLGTLVALLAARDYLLRRGKDSAALVFLATATAASVPALLTIVEWDRYYLFPVFFASMTSSIALGWLIRRLLPSFVDKNVAGSSQTPQSSD